MANEITFQAGLAVFKAATMHKPDGFIIDPITVTWTGTVLSKGYMSVGTTEETIPLGDITTPCIAMFWNKNATNFVELRNSLAGTVFARLRPSHIPAIIPLTPTAAPTAQADTAACIMEFFVLQL